MAWYNTTRGLMRMVELAKVSPGLLENHIEGVLPHLLLQRDRCAELVELFRAEKDHKEVALLESEVKQLEEGIEFYKLASGQTS